MCNRKKTIKVAYSGLSANFLNTCNTMLGTPGRVIDLLKRGALNLSEIQFVVLDEADQMLNVGFAEDVEVIMERLPQKRQFLMFSATMPQWIQKMTRKYLQNPVVVDLVSCLFLSLLSSIYKLCTIHKSASNGKRTELSDREGERELTMVIDGYGIWN